MKFAFSNNLGLPFWFVLQTMDGVGSASDVGDGNCAVGCPDVAAGVDGVELVLVLLC